MTTTFLAKEACLFHQTNKFILLEKFYQPQNIPVLFHQWIARSRAQAMDHDSSRTSNLQCSRQIWSCCRPNSCTLGRDRVHHRASQAEAHPQHSQSSASYPAPLCIFASSRRLSIHEIELRGGFQTSPLALLSTCKGVNQLLNKAGWPLIDWLLGPLMVLISHLARDLNLLLSSRRDQISRARTF